MLAAIHSILRLIRELGQGQIGAAQVRFSPRELLRMIFEAVDQEGIFGSIDCHLTVIDSIPQLSQLPIGDAQLILNNGVIPRIV